MGAFVISLVRPLIGTDCSVFSSSGEVNVYDFISLLLEKFVLNA